MPVIRQFIRLVLPAMILFGLPLPVSADVDAVCKPHRSSWTKAKASANKAAIDGARARIPGGACPDLKREAAAYRAPAPKPSKQQAGPKQAPTNTTTAVAAKKPQSLPPAALKKSAAQLFSEAVAQEKALNYVAAFPLFERGCQLKDAKSCAFAANYREFGKGVPKSTEQAAALYGTGCGLGSGYNCYYQAKVQEEILSRPDLARINYDKACLQNAFDGIFADMRGQSCTASGLLSQNGRGGRVDYATALGRYKRGCDLTDQSGCHNAGYLEYKGLGTPQDINTAIARWEGSCSRNLAASCDALGSTMLIRYPAYKDTTTLRQAFVTGCGGKKHDAQGSNCGELGYMEEFGIGGKKDAVQARVFYEKGCKLRDPYACFNMAMTWRYGIGGQTNAATADSYDAKACSYGMKALCKTK